MRLKKADFRGHPILIQGYRLRCEKSRHCHLHSPTLSGVTPVSIGRRLLEICPVSAWEIAITLMQNS